MTTALSDLLEIYEINADIRKNIMDNIDRTPDIRNAADPQKGKSTVIRATKMQEAGKAKNSATDSMKEAIGSAELFINGAHVTDIHTHDAASRINEPLAQGQIPEPCDGGIHTHGQVIGERNEY